jgi:O-antigen biosynthesis protein
MAAFAKLRLIFKLAGQAAAHPGRLWSSLSGRNIRHFFYLLKKTDAAAVQQMVGSYLQPASEQIPHPTGGIKLEGIQDLAFNLPNSPLVSIIIPVYNHWQHTYGCLQSILENTLKTSYEVIIADDSSTDETGEMLKKVAGVRVSRNPQNLGFLRNCNHHALLARGKYILFLNNDIFVAKNWLEPLAEAAEKDGKVGIVGVKVLDKDGKLQECGWTMQKDGWGFPIGRGDSPSRDQYNLVKEVDCISGCCFLVRKDVFEAVGGFDERYAPAYYEEFDLCFAVRDKGYKVIVQPESMVTHHDAASYGHSRRNRLNESHGKLFQAKWKKVLDKFS